MCGFGFFLDTGEKMILSQQYILISFFKISSLSSKSDKKLNVYFGRACIVLM